VAHSVCGNPDRLRTGVVELEDDDEWTAAMSGADRRFVTAMAWPLLLRYGYLGRRRSPPGAEGSAGASAAPPRVT
jgi:hypothetical protein